VVSWTPLAGGAAGRAPAAASGGGPCSGSASVVVTLPTSFYVSVSTPSFSPSYSLPGTPVLVRVGRRRNPPPAVTLPRDLPSSPTPRPSVPLRPRRSVVRARVTPPLAVTLPPVADSQVQRGVNAPLWPATISRAVLHHRERATQPPHPPSSGTPSACQSCWGGVKSFAFQLEQIWTA